MKTWKYRAETRVEDALGVFSWQAVGYVDAETRSEAGATVIEINRAKGYETRNVTMKVVI